MNAPQASAGCASGDGGPRASGGGASGGWASGDGGPGRGPTACGMRPDQIVRYSVFCVHKYMTITKHNLPHPLCETSLIAEKSARIINFSNFSPKETTLHFVGARSLLMCLSARWPHSPLERRVVVGRLTACRGTRRFSELRLRFSSESPREVRVCLTHRIQSVASQPRTQKPLTSAMPGMRRTVPSPMPSGSRPRCSHVRAPSPSPSLPPRLIRGEW